MRWTDTGAVVCVWLAVLVLWLVALVCALEKAEDDRRRAEGVERRVVTLEKRADWLVGCEERRLKEAWGVGQEMDWGCRSERR